MFKVILSRHIFGSDNQRIYIGTGAVYAQTETAICEDLAAGISDQGGIARIFLFCDSSDELIDYSLDVGENLFPACRELD